MKMLICNDRADAQALADACHQWLLDNNPAYYDDVFEGRTMAWAIPSETEEASGVWQIPVTAELSPVDPRIADLFPVEAWAL